MKADGLYVTFENDMSEIITIKDTKGTRSAKLVEEAAAIKQKELNLYNTNGRQKKYLGQFQSHIEAQDMCDWTYKWLTKGEYNMSLKHS